jgi:putative FmdB family regulatory protein
MPTYEYACKNCGEHLEVVQSFKDEPLTECPACRGTLRKVFGSIGIAFKGSGFYKTDSRAAAKTAKSESSSASSSAASSSSSSGESGSSGSGSSGSGSGSSGSGSKSSSSEAKAS